MFTRITQLKGKSTILSIVSVIRIKIAIYKPHLPRSKSRRCKQIHTVL